MGKERYRIRNWSQYNKSLVQRGSITFWFSEEVAQGWIHINGSKKKRGRQKIYSDVAIECALTLKTVFHLRLRATQGFLQSLLFLMNLTLPCPDYTTLSKRAKFLDIKLPVLSQKENMHVLVDSTGLKIFGEGEWKTRMHGISKRRTWRKLHLGIDADTQEIVASTFTTNSVSDDQAFPELMKGLPNKIASVKGDGAYDTKNCYREILRKEGIPIIPPRKTAALSTDMCFVHRNQAILEIISSEDKEEARKQWKERSGYHKRSLVETQMFRLKTIFGRGLSSRNIKNQAIESFIKCKSLNRMTHLGMPESYRVAV